MLQNYIYRMSNLCLLCIELSTFVHSFCLSQQKLHASRLESLFPSLRAAHGVGKQEIELQENVCYEPTTVAPGVHGPVYAEVSHPQQHRKEIRTEGNIAYGHNRPQNYCTETLLYRYHVVVLLHTQNRGWKMLCMLGVVDSQYVIHVMCG